MTNEEIKEKVRQLYHLTDAQIKEVTENAIFTLKKFYSPSEKPMVVIVGGQSGSGKTALIHYTSEMSDNRKFVKIDNDYFRSIHPYYDEIIKNHPDYYTVATDQLGLGITADVIKYFTENRYNIILHQTLKNNRVVDDAITKFIDAGYTVGVRAFAVPYFESKMSQIERCEGQIKQSGFCRHVAKIDHDTALEGLPNTVDYVEQSGKYDFIQIFKRGSDISLPTLVYSKFNEKTKAHTLQIIEDCSNDQVPMQDQTSGFASAKEAVEKTRESEAVRCMRTLDARIHDAERSRYNNEEMQMHIDELKGRMQEYKKKNKLTKPVIKQVMSCRTILAKKIVTGLDGITK